MCDIRDLMIEYKQIQAKDKKNWAIYDKNGYLLKCVIKYLNMSQKVVKYHQQGDVNFKKNAEFI